MTEQKITLVQKAYDKNADFEKVRNMVEARFGITVKNSNDILRASTLDVISTGAKTEKEALQLGVSVKAVTKSTAKKLGVADLF